MATIDETMEVKLDQLLAVFAYNYMKQHQGDIIIDHRNIFKTLEKNGEIEVYLSKFHFDTENRFRFGDDEMPVEQARENARKQKWGEYIIKIKIDNHRLLIETENGTIYRKEDWENADPDEIIYIGEFGLAELDKLIEEGKNPTDAELIEQNIASSKNSIRAEIKQYYPEATDEWIDKHDLIADIMEFASWEYTATVVDQIDEWDIWDDYPEK